MEDISIVFMGTPDFAVAILDALIQSKFKVVGVITAPDKPAGRGRKLNQSAVKKYALEKTLPVLQPANLKNPAFIESLKSFNANLQVVVAFRMLPKVVWELPKFGTLNLHASLLPNYRGAAPINWAIINGETNTGVSTFFIDEKIDTGRIILQKEIAIGEDETVGELHDKMMSIGGKLVLDTVDEIHKGTVKTFQQPAINLKPAPKIFSETCRINWHNSMSEIYNLIRGLNPFPGAWTLLMNEHKEIKLKIYDVKKEVATHSFQTGRILSSNKELKIAVANGFIKIESLQLPGKRKMDVRSLLHGFTFYENDFVQ